MQGLIPARQPLRHRQGIDEPYVRPFGPGGQILQRFLAQAVGAFADIVAHAPQAEEFGRLGNIG